MSARMRSPNYPSTPLGQAIVIIGKIHKVERTNPIDREVAAQAAGYSGISGRSAKVLSNLIQYGLLEKGGKNEVRVSRRAVEILHPESDDSKRRAIHEAAFEPELFRRIGERFPDGRPSEASLRSYFVREEFTDAAIPAAIRAYMETCEFLEQENAFKSRGNGIDVTPESLEDQQIRAIPDMRSSTKVSDAHRSSGRTDTPYAHVGAEFSTGLDWANRRILLPPMVASKAEARDVIDMINAMIQHLPDGISGPHEDSAESQTDSGDE